MIQTGEDGIYMVRYIADNRKDVYPKKVKQDYFLYSLSYTDYPSKGLLEFDLEQTAIPYGSETDSIGIYSKINHKVLAMFYSKRMEDRGSSSTHYSNPIEISNSTGKNAPRKCGAQLSVLQLLPSRNETRLLREGFEPF